MVKGASRIPRDALSFVVDSLAEEFNKRYGAIELIQMSHTYFGEKKDIAEVYDPERYEDTCSGLAGQVSVATKAGAVNISITKDGDILIHMERAI